jgi:CxxC motif-containing protein
MHSRLCTELVRLFQEERAALHADLMHRSRRNSFFDAESRGQLFPVGCTLGIVDDVMRPVYVHNCPISQTARFRNIFRSREVVMSLPKKLICLAKAAMRTERSVDGKWIIETLSIVDRSALDFVDCSVDFANRFLVIVFDRPPCPSVIQIMPRGA